MLCDFSTQSNSGRNGSATRLYDPSKPLALSIPTDLNVNTSKLWVVGTKSGSENSSVVMFEAALQPAPAPKIVYRDDGLVSIQAATPGCRLYYDLVETFENGAAPKHTSGNDAGEFGLNVTIDTSIPSRKLFQAYAIHAGCKRSAVVEKTLTIEHVEPAELCYHNGTVMIRAPKPGATISYEWIDRSDDGCYPAVLSHPTTAPGPDLAIPVAGKEGSMVLAVVMRRPGMVSHFVWDSTIAQTCTCRFYPSVPKVLVVAIGYAKYLGVFAACCMQTRANCGFRGVPKLLSIGVVMHCKCELSIAFAYRMAMHRCIVAGSQPTFNMGLEAASPLLDRGICRQEW